MAIKARKLRRTYTLSELGLSPEYDATQKARQEGYDQAFKDITERLREMYKAVPEDMQKVLMEHLWDIIE